MGDMGKMKNIFLALLTCLLFTIPAQAITINLTSDTASGMLESDFNQIKDFLQTYDTADLGTILTWKALVDTEAELKGYYNLEDSDINTLIAAYISDTAYGSGWNGDTGAASKNAIYDKIESLTLSGGATAWNDIGDPDEASEIDTGAYITELNVDDFRIGDGGSNYVKFSDTGMTFAGTYTLTMDLNLEDQATSPDSTGMLVYDNDVAGLDNGSLAWMDNDGNVRYPLDYATLPSTDGQIVIYNATTDKWVPLVLSGDATMLQTGAVSVSDLTIASQVAGDILYFNGTNWVRLAKGTDGEVLKLASGVPDWGTDNSGSDSEATIEGYIFDSDNTGNLGTTGTLKGRLDYGADITASTSHDTTEVHNAAYHFTAAATVTLDAAADAGYGAVVSYRVRDASEEATIDVQSAEKINLDGTALAAGTAIAATGAGSFVTLVATTDTDGSGTDGWEVWGNNGFESE